MTDLDRIAIELQQAGIRVGALASAALRKTALDIEATAKAFVPVDTGNLRASISHDFDGDGRSPVMRAEIGPTAEYGAYVEYGTARHGPAAYMGPAFDRHAWELPAAVAMLTEKDLPS